MKQIKCAINRDKRRDSDDTDRPKCFGDILNKWQ